MTHDFDEKQLFDTMVLIGVTFKTLKSDKAASKAYESHDVVKWVFDVAKSEKFVKFLDDNYDAIKAEIELCI